MKFLAILLLTTASTWASDFTLTTLATDKYHTPTTICSFNGQTAKNPPCMATYTDTTMGFPTLVYGYGGIPFTYNIPAPGGACNVEFLVEEPNKTAVNQRVFSIQVNGRSIGRTDIVSSVPTKTSISITLSQVPAVNGFFIINFIPSVGNAVVSQIKIGNCNYQNVNDPNGFFPVIRQWSETILESLYPFKKP